MAARIWFAVALGGALGALARHGVNLWCGARQDGAFPKATFIVNAVGSLVLGVLLGMVLSGKLGSPAWRAFLTTGFCGALTTFSTFSVDAVQLIRSGHPGMAAVYVGANVALCLSVAAVGIWATGRA